MIFRWTCLSIPRRPHKTPAHTVKDLSAPKPDLSVRFDPEPFVPVSRLSYITFRFRQHPSSSFFRTGRLTQPPRKASSILGNFRCRLHRSNHPGEGPRIIHPVFVSSTLGVQLSFRRKPTQLNPRTTHSRPSDPDSASDFRLSEGARIILAIRCRWKRVRRLFFPCRARHAGQHQWMADKVH